MDKMSGDGGHSRGELEEEEKNQIMFTVKNTGIEVINK